MVMVVLFILLKERRKEWWWRHRSLMVPPAPRRRRVVVVVDVKVKIKKIHIEKLGDVGPLNYTGGSCKLYNNLVVLMVLLITTLNKLQFLINVFVFVRLGNLNLYLSFC